MINYKDLQEKGICWTGYKRKKGTKPYEEDSCVKEAKDALGHGSEKRHVIAFGRMNPITSGHEAVVNKVHDVAKKQNATHSIIVSHSQDAKKNPLTGEQKVQHAKNAFPGTNVSSASKDKPTILHHAAAAHAAGAQHLHVVAGSDRHEEMHNLLHKYNDKDSAHGHYNFKSITVHSSGERDPDSEGTTGISASKMREYAASGNKKAFHAGAPSKMKPEHKDAMYNDVRKGMNIKEETTPYWKKPSFNKRMSALAKQERLARERKAAEQKPVQKPVKEETLDQQDDHAKQLKRFKDQMSQANGPQKETATELDNLEKEIMSGTVDAKHGLMHNPDPSIESNVRVNKIKQMTEELHPNMGAVAYIHDFISSTNPKFNNKSEEERRKMAIGAYMAAKSKLKEGAMQPNGTDKIDTATSEPTASTAKDTTMSKKIKGFKFFKGENETQMNMNQPVKEAKDEQEYGYEGDMALNQLATLTRCAEMIKDLLKPDTDMPEWVQSKITLATDYIQTAADYMYSESEVNEQAPVAPVPDKKYIKGTPEHKAYKATKKPINGMPTNVKEEVEELDEKSDQAKQNKTMKNMMDASRGARFKLNNPVPAAEPEHKTAQAHNKAIGRALRNEESLDEVATGNPGNGYHGQHQSADDKYEATHKHIKNLTDADDKTVKHYMDSTHGRHLAGREEDHEYIKNDFKKFKKYYKPEMHEEKSKIGKPVNVDDVNAAGQEPHEEKWEPAPKKVSKLKKEENMKSYKEFLQSLDEKLIGGQKKLDKNHNGKLDAEDFKKLRNEEAEPLDEIEFDKSGRYVHKGTYGSSFNPKPGHEETPDDEKAEKKAAGRKAGQSTGSYKPRATMSKLKSAGSTYK
jgi:nicotinic acid mononucleotide adenylyltransferase